MLRSGRESFGNICYRASFSLLILPRYWPSFPDEVTVSTYLGRWRSWQSPTVTPWGDKIIIRLLCFLLRLSRLTLFILLMEEFLHQVVDRLCHYLQGFIHPRWCRIPTTNSRTFIFWGNSTGKMNLLKRKKRDDFLQEDPVDAWSFLFCGLLLCPQSEEGTVALGPAMGQMSFAISCLADKEKSRIEPMKFLTSRMAPRML